MAASLIVWLALLLSVGCIIRLPITEVTLKEGTVGEKRSRPTFGHQQSQIKIDVYDDANKMFMLTTLYMGADKRPVQLILDSGSSALWINDYDCGTDAGGLLGDCQDASGNREFGYLDGVIRGKLARTSVWLGGGEAGVESKDHQVVVVDFKTSLMNFGIIGLCKGSGEDVTFLSTLKQNKLIPEEAFAIYHRDDVFDLILGGVDRSLVRPNAKEVTAQIVCEDAFFISVDSSLVGDTAISSSPLFAIVDSGNTLISFPGHLASSVIQVLANKGIECILADEQNPMFNILTCALDESRAFPDLSFVINGVPLTIPGSSLVSQCEDVVVANAYAYDDDDDGTNACYLKIEFFMQSNYFTLGKAFLEQIYTTFNLDKQSITFVQNI